MVAGKKQDIINQKAEESARPKKGMVLPFQPLTLAFDHVNYYIDMPSVNYFTLFYHLNNLLNMCFLIDDTPNS